MEEGKSWDAYDQHQEQTELFGNEDQQPFDA